LSGLKNGAREVARVTGAQGRQWVLAETAGSLPWVTWEVDDDGNAYSGHYFYERLAAAEDLIKRWVQ
jgi:hypothetical protein